MIEDRIVPLDDLADFCQEQGLAVVAITWKRWDMAPRALVRRIGDKTRTGRADIHPQSIYRLFPRRSGREDPGPAVGR